MCFCSDVFLFNLVGFLVIFTSCLCWIFLPLFLSHLLLINKAVYLFQVFFLNHQFFLFWFVSPRSFSSVSAQSCYCSIGCASLVFPFVPKFSITFCCSQDACCMYQHSSFFLKKKIKAHFLFPLHTLFVFCFWSYFEVWHNYVSRLNVESTI